MPREHHYCVYIMQSASRRALYIGMTNNLHKRVWQHKNHISKVSPMTTMRSVSSTGRASTMYGTPSTPRNS